MQYTTIVLYPDILYKYQSCFLVEKREGSRWLPSWLSVGGYRASDLRRFYLDLQVVDWQQ